MREPPAVLDDLHALRHVDAAVNDHVAALVLDRARVLAADVERRHRPITRPKRLTTIPAARSDAAGTQLEARYCVYGASAPPLSIASRTVCVVVTATETSSASPPSDSASPMALSTFPTTTERPRPPKLIVWSPPTLLMLSPHWRSMSKRVSALLALTACPPSIVLMLTRRAGASRPSLGV